MTSDPDRLLRSAATGDGAELERELLRSIVDVSPPDGAREAAWRGISAQIAGVSVVAAAASAAAYARAATQALPTAAGATSLAPQAGASLIHMLTTKVVIGAVVVAGATTAIGAAWLAETGAKESPASAAGASPRVEPEHVLPPAGPALPEEVTEVAPSTKPAVAPPATPENARPARQRLDEALALESALVTQARADLKRGDPRAALATLQRLKRESPRGVLHQEREVLTVQALAAAGHKDAARARARAFIKSFPNSPHAPLLRSLASDP